MSGKAQAQPPVRQTIVQLLSHMRDGKEIREYLHRFSGVDQERFAVIKVGGAVTVLGTHLVNVKCLSPHLSEAEVFYTMRVVWACVSPLRRTHRGIHWPSGKLASVDQAI